MIYTALEALTPPAIQAEISALALQVRAVQRDLWRFCAEYVLGTRLEILVATPHQVSAARAIHAALKEINRLNRVFNHRMEESELSRLNRCCQGTISEDLFTVLELSEMWRHISRGAVDGRMGALLELWKSNSVSSASELERAKNELRNASVNLARDRRHVSLSPNAKLSLDAIAKGYIVDSAFNAACRDASGIDGLAINIGGDIRFWGQTLQSADWRVGIANPLRPVENAPLVDAVYLRNAAMATSGRGPRDYRGNCYRSTTISPFTGRPVEEIISASVVATHAADADAIATACLVLDPDDSIALVDELGMAARITNKYGEVHQSSRWQSIQIAAAAGTQRKQTPASAKLKSTAKESEKSSLENQRWPADWEIGITYTEPTDKERPGADFRDPYIAIWITDEQNKPVSTIFMLGTTAKWHRDNFIWWNSQGERANELVDLRSQATTRSGIYHAYWGGTDDSYKPVKLGRYVLHLETSQERGKHSHRIVPLDIGRDQFKLSLPNIIDSGGIEITYGHYNDRFKSEY